VTLSARMRTSTKLSGRRCLGRAAILVVIASSLALVGLAGSPARADQPGSPAHACAVDGPAIACTTTYTFTGEEQSFEVPVDVTQIGVQAVGANGGGWGGRGAVIEAGFPVTASDVFFVTVGGQGGWGQAYNGGGYSPVGLGGGGATDIRTVSATAEGAGSKESRILIAGGGGGGGDGGGGYAPGGDSALNGVTPPNAPFSCCGWSSGGGASQTDGGYAGGSSNGYGGGGGGAADNGGGAGDFYGSHGGGGGGGLYGGGGGGIFNGGGGGSSLVPDGAEVSVNEGGLPAGAAFTYRRPITGMISVSGDESTTAGTSVAYTAVVTDGYETASTTPETLAIFPHGPGTGATCSETTCTATRVGTYQVTGGYAGWERSTTLTVTAGPLASSSLAPETTTVRAGESVAFTVSGTDVFGNPQAVPDGWTTISVSPAGGGEPAACPDRSCTVGLAGDYVVSALTTLPEGSAFTSLTAGAMLTVTPGPVASLEVSPDGATTAAGDPVTYSAVARDELGNLIEGQHVSFSYADGGHDVVCPEAACSPTSAGDVEVTATALPGGGQPPVTETVGLTVVPTGVAALSVTPDNATTPAGTGVQYAVGGVDEFGNALPDQTAASTVTFTPIAGGDSVVCADALCAPTTAGVYQVDVSEPGPNAPLPDATTLTVGAADLVETWLEPADLSVVAGAPVSYSVFGEDTYGNALDEQTAASSIEVAPADGGVAIPCPRGVCRVTDAGSWVVTSTTPGVEGDVVATTALDVQPGVLAALRVQPGTSQTRTGVPVTYTVTGDDRFGNEIGDVTGDATLTLVRLGDGDPTSCEGAVCTPYAAGTYQVVAELDGLSGVASLHVLATRASIAVDPEGDTAGLTFGDAVPVAATVTSPDGPVPSGRVQFSLDGAELGKAVLVGNDGAAHKADLEGIGAGLHTLKAEFVSEPDGAFTLASDQTSFVIGRVATTTQLTVRPDSLTAIVGAGALSAPTGLVQFNLNGHDLGYAPLTDGVAVLESDTTIARGAVASAVYLGDADHLPSTGSTARQDPVVTATVHGAGGAGPVAGWYRSPVTVTFACTAGSSPVTCPAPVVLDHEGAGQTVSRTVVADDGGTAVVTAGPVDLDLSAPAAKVVGVVDGKVYNGPPPAASCAASDALSGLVSCTVATTGGFPGTFASTATAVDRAGNSTTSTVTYGSRDLWIGRGEPEGGAWPVRIGKSVSLLVASQHPPTLAGRLVRSSDGFRWAGHRNGISRWVSRVRVPASARPGDVIVYQVEIGGETRTVRLRAVRR